MKTPNAPKINLASVSGSLSRSEMRNIMGGVDFEVDPGDGTGSYKCCWGGWSSSCSSCVAGPKHELSCTQGNLVAC